MKLNRGRNEKRENYVVACSGAIILRSRSAVEGRQQDNVHYETEIEVIDEL